MSVATAEAGTVNRGVAPEAQEKFDSAVAARRERGEDPLAEMTAASMTRDVIGVEALAERSLSALVAVRAEATTAVPASNAEAPHRRPRKKVTLSFLGQQATGYTPSVAQA